MPPEGQRKDKLARKEKTHGIEAEGMTRHLGVNGKRGLKRKKDTAYKLAGCHGTGTD